MNLETQKLRKRIEIHQSEITIRDLLNPFPKRSVKLIDGSEKRNHQLAFELQNSHVCEKAVLKPLPSSKHMKRFDSVKSDMSNLGWLLN